MREAGVKKPILNMAEVSEQEMEESVRHGVTPTVWLDDAPRRVERIAQRLGQPVPVQLFLDTGMNREGMPYRRAWDWMETLCNSDSANVVGLELGTLHAAPTFELFQLPEAHLDMVRPGNALFGNYPSVEGMQELADLKPVFRLCARVVRLERLEPGEGAGFYRSYMVERPTWIALLPIGHTDGYPHTAAGTCEVLIGGQLYPVIASVNSAHTIVEIGSERTVQIGDVATLIGPDNPAILPHTVADRTGVRFLRLIQKLNVRLPRRVV
jgi:alanine racemase